LSSNEENLKQFSYKCDWSNFYSKELKNIYLIYPRNPNKYKKQWKKIGEVSQIIILFHIQKTPLLYTTKLIIAFK